MAKKTENRIIIHLSCNDCKERTYTTTKSKRNDPQRLELRKYCPRCRAHRVYKEVK